MNEFTAVPDEDEVSTQLLEGTADHAVFMLSPDGDIETWPDPARGLYGYTAETARDRPFRFLLADGDGVDPSVETVLDGARDGTVRTAHWHRRADGSVFWATLSLSPLRNDRFHGYAVVSQDATESHQHVQMLERQNDRLKEFTDILAHDLRNPIAAILGDVEITRKTGNLDRLESLEDTAHRMERLIDDLLRVARHGEVVTDPEPTEFEGIVRTSWKGTGEQADGPSLRYETVGTVAASADRLHELFENLFRNAIEHGGEDVTVRVGPLSTGFYVEDNGSGIPTENRSEVFEHGFSTNDSGTGYGLSIVRTIAGAHGWDVTVTESESGGARVEVTGIEFLD